MIFSLEPRDPKQLLFLKRRFKAAITLQPSLAKLRPVLLSIGGYELVVPGTYDTDLPYILSDGFFTDGTATIKRMRECECHTNVAKLFRNPRNKIVGIRTGYALSVDGLWRQHSWAVHKTDGLIETTESRLAYFGVHYSDAVFFDTASSWADKFLNTY